MYAAFMAVWLLATVPVDIRIFLSITAVDAPSATLDRPLYGTGIKLHFRLSRLHEQLFLLLRLGNNQKEFALRLTLSKKPRTSFKNMYPPLKKHLSSFFARSGAHIRMGTGDAAATALWCATIQSLNMFNLPFTLYAEPIYDVSSLVFQLRCISFFRLGKLWITALLLWAAQLTKKMAGGMQHGNAKTAA